MYNMVEIFVLLRGGFTVSTLANRIKELRNSHHLSQEQLGNIIGVAKSTISSYENGNSTPADEIKTSICKYFNVSMDYLMGISADVILGTELKQIIEDIAKELNEPYDKLVDIFLHKEIPNDITRNNLMAFFCALLNKQIKAAHNGLPLSAESSLDELDRDLLSLTSSMNDDEKNAVLGYAARIVAKHKKED